MDIEDRINISEEQYAHWQRRLQVRKSAERITLFKEDSPHDILGLHKENGAVVLRVNLPHARRAWIKTSEGLVILNRLPNSTVHEVEVKDDTALPCNINYSTEEYILAGLIEKRRQELVRENRFQLSPEELNRLLETELTALLEREHIKSDLDPYSFPPDITDDDLWFWGEGKHLKAYERFGARLRTINGVPGVNFIVWAPNAKALSVVGTFNGWEVGAHPLSRIGSSGIWGLFIPGLGEGTVYKFAIKNQYGEVIDFKADPFALYSQFPTKFEPEKTASIVTDLNKFEWEDSDWIKKRSESKPLKNPMSTLEVHLGSWKRINQRYNNEGFLNYRELAHEIVSYVLEMGYTHIQILPVMEHPFYGSWGYQSTGYFSPTGRYGKPEDLMYLINHCHKNDLGVFLDWVPGHFPKNMDALNMFDGTQIFAYEDPRKGEHKKWGTLVPDYGKGGVRSFLVSSAYFWLDKYHVDGLRVDAVASMLYLDYDRQGQPWISNIYGGNEHLEAVEFLRDFNTSIHDNYPGVLTIAEDSSSWQGVTSPPSRSWKSLGFDLKWNMGWMNNTLGHFRKDPINRKNGVQSELVHSSSYAFTEDFILPLSHDEVVHRKGSLIGKMPGDEWQKFANLRLLYGYMFTYPGKKLLFMGNDFAQKREWDCDSSLDWNLITRDERHKQIQDLIKDLNHLYLERKELHELDHDQMGLEWIEMNEPESVIAYLRKSSDKNNFYLVVCNLTPVPRENYELSVPSGTYKEFLNTDDQKYGGAGNHKNSDNLPTSQISSYKWNRDVWTQYRSAIRVTVPPLAVTIYEKMPQ